MVYEKAFNPLVTKGPSKMDLVTAFAYAYDEERGPFSVVLNLDNDEHDLPKPTRKVVGHPSVSSSGIAVAAKITKLEHENGSGESFIIKGYLAYHSYANFQDPFDIPFEGYYSTQTRSGKIGFTLSIIDDR